MLNALALKLKKKRGNCLWFPVVYSFVCRFWILHSLNCIDLVTWSPVTIMTWACWCPINLQLSFNSAEVKLGASSMFLKAWNTPELIYLYSSMVHSVWSHIILSSGCLYQVGHNQAYLSLFFVVLLKLGNPFGSPVLYPTASQLATARLPHRKSNFIKKKIFVCEYTIKLRH